MLDDHRIRVRFPDRKDIFSLEQQLFTMGVKWMGYENDHSYLSDVEVTSARSHTSATTPPPTLQCSEWDASLSK
jgi:hypothetical protein